jgi:hypothetical protein
MQSGTTGINSRRRQTNSAPTRKPSSRCVPVERTAPRRIPEAPRALTIKYEPPEAYFRLSSRAELARRKVYRTWNRLSLVTPSVEMFGFLIHPIRTTTAYYQPLPPLLLRSFRERNPRERDHSFRLIVPAKSHEPSFALTVTGGGLSCWLARQPREKSDWSSAGTGHSLDRPEGEVARGAP